MGCLKLDTDFFNFLEVIHSGKSACAEKKRINYYPYGMMHGGYNTFVHPYASAFNYGYGGKEYQTDNNIGWLDFGSRNYDPELGRWFNLDPQAERYNALSPFVGMGNNPIFYLDPNGEELITAIVVGAIIGGAIGATATAIANPAANFGDILKGGIIGAFAGAVTAGIGNAASVGSITALQATGAHGLFQGTLAAAQGGNFWQAAGIGLVSSGIAHGLSEAGALTQALGGATTGAFASKVTGGSFVEGFATGLTVAGLNHALHSVANNFTLRSRLIKHGYQPEEVASMSLEEVYTLTKKVFPGKYSQAGEPNFEIHETLPRNANGNVSFEYSKSSLGLDVTKIGNVQLSSSSFKSYFKLAGTIGHELTHRIDLLSDNWTKWANKNGADWANARAEVSAYKWQISVGSGYNVSEFLRNNKIVQGQ